MFALSFDVIDPCNRTGKISVPMRHIEETRGLVDFQRNPAQREVKDLSLCLLFQRGQCRAGSRCHQVHANPDYIADLREKATTGATCCAEHGDIHSCGFMSSTQMVKVTGGEAPMYFPLAAFGRTAAMDAFLRNAAGGTVLVSCNKVCRLHAMSRCKFGKDCKNIHICPHAVPAAAPQEIAVPPLASLHCRSTSQSQSQTLCGLSVQSSRPSSFAGSPPPECHIEPALDVSVLSNDEFLMKSVLEASPAFDASGFEFELSQLCTELCDSVLCE